MPVGEDQPRRGEVQGQAENRRQQQNGWKRTEIERSVDEHDRHQDQHRERDRQRQREVEHPPGHRHDHDGKDADQAEREGDVAAFRHYLERIETQFSARKTGGRGRSVYRNRGGIAVALRRGTGFDGRVSHVSVFPSYLNMRHG